MNAGGTRRAGALAAVSRGDDGPAEPRISELGEILALGLIRLQARMTSDNSTPNGECSLDFARLQSGDRDRSPKGKRRHAP
jgi:hypothetical protein